NLQGRGAAQASRGPPSRCHDALWLELRQAPDGSRDAGSLHGMSEATREGCSGSLTSRPRHSQSPMHAIEPAKNQQFTASQPPIVCGRINPVAQKLSINSARM